MIAIDASLNPSSLLPHVDRLFGLSAIKIRSLDCAWDPNQGPPVYTVEGRYTSRGWTEWTIPLPSARMYPHPPDPRLDDSRRFPGIQRSRDLFDETMGAGPAGLPARDRGRLSPACVTRSGLSDDGSISNHLYIHGFLIKPRLAD